MPRTPEQIQSEKTAKRGCLIFAGAVLALFSVVGIVESISESIEKGKIRAEVDRKGKIEQRSSTEAAQTILPGINRYADIMEGKATISSTDQKKEALALRVLAELADKQSEKINALGWGGLSTAKSWQRLQILLISDALDFESCSGPVLVCPDGPASHFLRMKKDDRATAASMHRKLASVFQQHANEGFVNCASLETDLYGVGGYFAPPERDKYQRYVSEHPEVCADRTAAQCAELPGLMKQACDGLGGCTDLGVK